jgi:branched-chain amino acid transport system substrate-binding protein
VRLFLLRTRVTLSLLLTAAGLARAQSGVTDTEVVIGERSAFSGSSAGLGIELWRGEISALSVANDKGGVLGRRVKLVLADDAYEPEKATQAVNQLVERDHVFALFGGVGTPTIAVALPVILKHFETEHLFQFSNFTGAQIQREPPFNKAVFNIRASYREEAIAMVDAFVSLGRKHIGLFVQDDAYGASGRDAVKRALKAHHMKLAADTTYPRGQPFETSTTLQLKALTGADVDALICVSSYQASAAIIRDARVAGWTVPIHNLSFVGADQMLAVLRREEKSRNQKLTANLIVTQVVPSYENLSLPLVREYRAALDSYHPVLPPGVGDHTYRPATRYSYGSFEGFVNARAFLAFLERAGKGLTREGFIHAAEAAGPVDIGLGVPLTFSPTQHQALERVWFTYVTDQGWANTDAIASIIQQ